MGFGSHCSDNNPDVIAVQTRKHLSGESDEGPRSASGCCCGLVNQQVEDWVLAAGEPQYSTIIKGTAIEHISDGHGCIMCSCTIYVSCALPFQIATGAHAKLVNFLI